MKKGCPVLDQLTVGLKKNYWAGQPRGGLASALGRVGAPSASPRTVREGYPQQKRPVRGEGSRSLNPAGPLARRRGE